MIKRLIFSLLFTTVLFTFAKAAAEWKFVPAFRVVSSEKDPSLDAQHARFSIFFDRNNFGDPASAAYVMPQIELSCNGVIRHIVPDSAMQTTIDVLPGSYQFMLYVTSDSSFREIISDTIVILPGYKTVVMAYFDYMPREPLKVIDTQPVNVVFKPVIYLYPETETAVDVQLLFEGALTYTYPDYASGWKGTAHPGGGVTIAGKTYPYLFWEGTHPDLESLEDHSAGFIVKKNEVTAFLEEKLTQMGLNDTEKADFITFWGPRMAASEQGLAHFLFNRDYNAIAQLQIDPKPEALFRVYLLWTPLTAYADLHPKAQEIPQVKREGFYAIEWGGSELAAYPDLLLLK